MWAILFLQVTLSASFIISKALLSYMPPFLLAGIRMFFGGSCLIAAVAFMWPKNFVLKKENILPLALAAFFGIYCTNTLEAWGLRDTIAAKAYFIYNMSPLIAALLGYLMFDERMTRKKWLGLGIGMVGFLPLIYYDLFTDNFFRAALPEIALLCAAAATVAGWVSKKKLIYYQGFSVVLANGITMTLGGAGAWLTAHAFETYDLSQIFSQAIVWELLIANIVLTCFIGYNLYAFLLKRYSATFTTFSGLFGSLLSAVFGWIFLGESVSWPFYLSFCLVGFGLFLFHQEEIKQKLINDEAGI